MQTNKSWLKQIYHHYNKWEDFHAGLYGIAPPETERDLIKMAIKILSNPILCRKAMMEVVRNWPFSCEQNLTNRNRNRRAWLGQAACCFEGGVNEDLTKIAWHKLSKKEQNRANHIADVVIDFWEEQYQYEKEEKDAQILLWDRRFNCGKKKNCVDV
jgi:hypothetical protein